MVTIVKIKEKFFLLNEDGVMELNEDIKKIDVLVVHTVNEEEIIKAKENGYKLFECKDDVKDCLNKIYNILFTRKKSCKFA